MRKKINYFFYSIIVFIGLFILSSCGGSSKKISDSKSDSSIIESSNSNESIKESNSNKDESKESLEKTNESDNNSESSKVESKESSTKEESSSTSIPEVETTYKVYHYQEELDKDGYKLKALEEIPGTSSYLTEAETKDYQGFIAQKFEQEIIMPDGSTEIRIYYNRPRYEVKVEKTGSGTVTGSGTYKEGQTATCTQEASYGYEFEGWYVCDTFITNDASYSFIVGENTTVYCKFKNQTINYQVNHLKENVNNNEYTLIEGDSRTLSGDSFSQTNAIANSYIGFSPKEIEQKEINPDGSTVVNIYYERNKHTVSISNLSPERGSASGAGKFKYGSDVTVNASANTGYEFDGWYINNERVSQNPKYTFTMDDSNVSLEARFNVQIIEYPVYHYQETLSGTYALVGQADVLSGEAFTMTNAKANTYEGFTAKTIEQKEINPDGTTTVCIYYDRIIRSVSIDYDTTKGSVTGIGTYKYGLSITVTATPLDAYEFDGWYINNTLKNSNTPYTFSIGLDDISLEARFKYKNANYTVEHYKENIDDSNYTIVSNATQTLSGTAYSLTNATAKSYTGFTVKEVEQKEINPDGSTVVKVYYNRVRYSFTIVNKNSSSGSVSGSGTYKYEQVATAKATAYTGYYFAGFSDSNNATSISNSSATRTYTITSNKTIYAYFNTNQHDINLNVTGTNKSNVTISGTTSSYGYYYYGYTYTVTVSISDNSFISIQVGDNALVMASTYEFTMPDKDIDVYVNVSSMIRDGNKIYFGIYPQTEVKDSPTLTQLNKNISGYPTTSSFNGWLTYDYFDASLTNSYYMYYKDVVYNSAYYRAVYFTKYRPNQTTGTASTSTSISSQDDNNYLVNSVYWFKYEPITWTILEEKDGNALIIADLILDTREIYCSDSTSKVNHYVNFTTNPGSTFTGNAYANNYELSNMRRWLNAQFASQVFTTTQVSMINTTEVDNSASQSSSVSNNYYSNNTSDLLFLLSYQEYDKYFPDNTGTTVATDYAKCQGFNTMNSYWWLRTAGRNNGALVDAVNSSYGSYNTYSACNTYGGVRPACWVTLP